MIPEQWNKIVELFHAAREKAGGERVALLDSVCSDDSLLRQAVEQMLQDYEESGSFLNRLPADASAATDVLRTSRPRAVVRVDAYEVAGGDAWLTKILGDDPKHAPALARKAAARVVAARDHAGAGAGAGAA